MKFIRVFSTLFIASAFSCSTSKKAETSATTNFSSKKPNILFVISDDQSYPHASAYGYKAVKTPNFDTIAKAGILFTNAYVPSPGCSPSRAAILTGRNDWQLEEAGTHASSFPRRYKVYPDILEEAGYLVGYTGKGWGPGDWKVSGRSRNPAGKEYNQEKAVNPPKGVSEIDYVENFKAFLKNKKDDQPFCFWFGAQEPHRIFSKGIGLKSGKKLEDVVVPSFLPDTKEVRSDILDYCFEIEWFDTQLGRIIARLKETGELENTLIIVTSDNGMAFPRAKANTYDYGIHVPLAISWPGTIPSGKVSNNIFSLINIAPTVLDAAGIKIPDLAYPMAGKSMLGSLKNGYNFSSADSYSSRERHSGARYNNSGYPQRALRTGDYLYIQNFKPERLPAGAPHELLTDKAGKKVLGPFGAFQDIDRSPTLEYLIDHRNDTILSKYLHMATDLRPEIELYNVKADPGCLNNLATKRAFDGIRRKIKKRFETYLRDTNDPRILGKDDVFESYPRLKGAMREFPKP